MRTFGQLLRSVVGARRGRLVALYAFGLAVFALVAGDHVFHQSSDPHFVYQADAWLHGEVAIHDPKGDDWARVETVILDDGSQVRGRRLSSRPTFRVLGGAELPLARVARSAGMTTYMSFPPFPAVLMLPQVMLGGRAANDTLLTILIAASILPLLMLCLQRLAAAGLSTRSTGDQLWLVALLAFGTVFFFSAVQGRVWFTAHVIGVALALLYAWASIEARNPFTAGLALGLATMTRTPMAFMVPLFVLEAWRMAGGAAALRADRRGFVRALARPLIRFAIPVIAIGAIAVAYNLARFGEPTEFGHSYLAVRQQAQMEAHGLFSYQYLGRNLAVALTLIPEWNGHWPFLRASGHGLALWVTTPVLLLLLWPAERGPLHRALWLTVAVVAVPTLFYQNSGWLQFGYRFSLDYTPFLVLLLAVGGRRFGVGTRALIALGIAINLYGALMFPRNEIMRSGGNAYDVVVAN